MFYRNPPHPATTISLPKNADTKCTTLHNFHRAAHFWVVRTIFPGTCSGQARGCGAAWRSCGTGKMSDVKRLCSVCLGFWLTDDDNCAPVTVTLTTSKHKSSCTIKTWHALTHRNVDLCPCDVLLKVDYGSLLPAGMNIHHRGPGWLVSVDLKRFLIWWRNTHSKTMIGDSDYPFKSKSKVYASVGGMSHFSQKHFKNWKSLHEWRYDRLFTRWNMKSLCSCVRRSQQLSIQDKSGTPNSVLCVLAVVVIQYVNYQISSRKPRWIAYELTWLINYEAMICLGCGEGMASTVKPYIPQHQFLRGEGLQMLFLLIRFTATWEGINYKPDEIGMPADYRNLGLTPPNSHISQICPLCGNIWSGHHVYLPPQYSWSWPSKFITYSLTGRQFILT